MKKDFSEKNEGINLVMSGVRLIYDPDEKKFYAEVNEQGKEFVVDIDSAQFEDLIRLKLSRDLPTKSSTYHVKEIHDYIISYARYQSSEEKVSSNRYFKSKKEIVIDLGGANGVVVRITAGGVEILERSPIRFYRPQAQKSLGEVKMVKDESGGLEKLRKYFGKIGEDEFKLIICWIVAVIYTSGPYPILYFLGEPGTAKTFIMKVIRAIIDPAFEEMFSMPSTEQEFMVKASNNVVFLLDNVSEIRPRMSDVVCRTVSRGCVCRRKRAANDQEIFSKIQCGIIINATKDMVNKTDLADRMILITTGSISENERKSESELLHLLKNEKPEILGALYETIRKTMAKYDEIRTDFLPRMADFAKVACAVASALGWEQDALMKAYRENNSILSSRCLEDDEFLMITEKFIIEVKMWEGTSTEFLDILKKYNPEAAKKRYWPSTASHLTSRLNEAAPALRNRGIMIDYRRSGKKRTTRLQYIEN